MQIKTSAMQAETTDDLSAAAATARSALEVSHQMMAMLRDYADLEAQHATRLHWLSQRMGDCVNRMRLPHPAKQESDPEDDVEDELSARQSHCVAVMDQVVTFLTRFGSMHRHLSECLANDLFHEWAESLSVHEKRMDGQEVELSASRKQLEVSVCLVDFVGLVKLNMAFCVTQNVSTPKCGCSRRANHSW